MPCEVLHDYFYRISRGGSASAQPTLYDVLRVPAGASPAELRVAYKLRALELDSADAAHGERVELERAFNILAQPDLRAFYDARLTDPDGPAPFPYGGFGSLLATGERSRDGQAFFANRVLVFLPERRQRQFHAPLRNCDFYDDRALYHDARRKLEFWIDPAALHIVWDSSWNQWKHLLGATMQVNATFVQSGTYRHRQGKWELVSQEMALPSRLEVKLPANIQEQLETAKGTYHRFGQYSTALALIRKRIESQPVEKSDLEKICSDLSIPSGIDVSLISWRPDYDRFFYRQLSLCPAYLSIPGRVRLRPGEGRGCRNSSTRPCDVFILEAEEHTELFRHLHDDHEGRHPPQPQRRSREAGIPRARHSWRESENLASGIAAARGRENRSAGGGVTEP